MAIPTLIFVTYTKKPVPTKIFVTYKKSDTIRVTINADTTARISARVKADFDTAYLSTYATVASADTTKNLINSYSLKSDSKRIAQAFSTAIFDTSRQIVESVHTVSLRVDTSRKVYRTDETDYDTLRGVNGNYGLNADTVKTVTVTTNLLSDTTRQVTGASFSVTLTADTLLNRVRHEQSQGDTDYEIQADASINADVDREIRLQNDLNADTTREIRYTSASNSDTVVDIPYMSTALNPQSISINLEKGQLSETFEMVTPYDLALEATITGKLLDFAYNFRAWSSSGRGLMRTITGMYDIDKLLYTPFTYAKRKDSSITAKDHAGIVAKLLDKSLDFYADNFYPSEAFTGINGATIQNIISGLFGWAGNLPQDWINVILRGDRLKVVQRGHEPNTIDITGTKHSLPQIDRRLMRSVWSSTGTHSARNKLTISPLGFSGTIRFGDSKVTYRYGLVVREVTATAQGQSVTTYDYDYDDYLVKKVTTTPDEVITTTYDYAVTINDKYLATETAVSVDKSGNTNSTTVTQHVYLGNGWYGTTVYVDGEFNNSSVSNGKPGGKTSKYIVDQSNLNLGGKYPDNSGESYQGAALFDTSFPISDTATLKKLTKDIEWLNRKTEEKVSLDIWQYGHLIDFTDKIIYNGNTYYLESNQVQRTPTELKQTVSIIRWY